MFITVFHHKADQFVSHVYFCIPPQSGLVSTLLVMCTVLHHRGDMFQCCFSASVQPPVCLCQVFSWLFLCLCSMTCLSWPGLSMAVSLPLFNHMSVFARSFHGCFSASIQSPVCLGQVFPWLFLCLCSPVCLCQVFPWLFLCLCSTTCLSLPGLSMAVSLPLFNHLSVFARSFHGCFSASIQSPVCLCQVFPWLFLCLCSAVCLC